MDAEEMENMATVSRNYDIIHLLIKKGNFDLPNMNSSPKVNEEKLAGKLMEKEDVVVTASERPTICHSGALEGRGWTDGRTHFPVVFNPFFCLHTRRSVSRSIKNGLENAYMTRS